MADRPRYHNGIMVYTAQDIHDDVVDGMDPDCVFVGLNVFEMIQMELTNRRASGHRLTAERDELQRRLDAVVAKISEAVVSDDDCVCSMLCHSAIIAIAENE